MKNVLGVWVLSLSMVGIVHGQDRNSRSPLASPNPEILIAQVDDSDLRDEETLQELMQIEYDKDAWSMGAAVGASLLPGAGWGLVYADKPVQSLVPFVLSMAGYGVGVAYLMGAFDTSRTEICRHIPSSKRVDLDVCTYGSTPFDATNPMATSNRNIDPLSDPDPATGRRKQYYQTQNDYERTFIGEDFDGTDSGVWIMVGTYALTTVIGAVWAGMTVSAHNEQLRKDIESTAGRGSPQPTVQARPILNLGQRTGVVGFALDF